MPVSRTKCISTKVTDEEYARLEALAGEQTISEWETGAYQPRGTSARLLDIVAERAGLRYGEANPEADVP